jgi:hypothetical protein
MSAIITELMESIYSEISADSSISTLTNWTGQGTAPTGTNPEYLGWFLLSDDNDDFMQANTDYYKEVDIQFSAYTDETSPAKARVIRENVERLFRFNTLTLTTGRHISTEIGSGADVEDPESDGWTSATTLTFNIGT